MYQVTKNMFTYQYSVYNRHEPEAQETTSTVSVSTSAYLGNTYPVNWLCNPNEKLAPATHSESHTIMKLISRASWSTLLREWTRKGSAVLLLSWSFGWGPGGAGSGADGKTPCSCREPRQTPRGQLACWGKNFHPAHWTQNNTKEKNQVFVLFKGRTNYHYNTHKS